MLTVTSVVCILLMLTGISGVETLLFRELTTSIEGKLKTLRTGLDVVVQEVIMSINVIIEVPDLFVYTEYPCFY
jgi:hypothetical protein